MKVIFLFYFLKLLKEYKHNSNTKYNKVEVIQKYNKGWMTPLIAAKGSHDTKLCAWNFEKNV